MTNLIRIICIYAAIALTSETASAGHLFDNPIELFSEALIPSLSHSERAKVQTTLRGFLLRADLQSAMDQEYVASESGIYLDVAVRDPEEVPVFNDATTVKGSITTRIVEIPSQNGEEVALRVSLEYGKNAPVETLKAINLCIANITNKANKK